MAHSGPDVKRIKLFAGIFAAWPREREIGRGIAHPRSALPRGHPEWLRRLPPCVRNLGIHIPALLDNIDDRTEKAYTGWPDRLYLI